MNQSVVNEINNINMVIDDNISEKDYLNRGLLSQNILAQLRNLVEDVTLNPTDRINVITPNITSSDDIVISNHLNAGGERFTYHY